LDSENEKSKINKNTKKKVNITKPKKGEEQWNKCMLRLLNAFH
jgi:hypothetical protein